MLCRHRCDTGSATAATVADNGGGSGPTRAAGSADDGAARGNGQALTTVIEARAAPAATGAEVKPVRTCLSCRSGQGRVDGDAICADSEADSPALPAGKVSVRSLAAIASRSRIARDRDRYTTVKGAGAAAVAIARAAIARAIRKATAAKGAAGCSRSGKASP